MYYTYVIKCQGNGRYYIGHTADIVRRLEEHCAGKTRSLRNKGPFVLLYSEIHETKQAAYRRELQIKSYKGGEAFKRLILKEEKAN
ncbi:MAG: GIY-YIG nuclease family protein [bacterium]|nr:GIY-YIG nuclease family protein [bacterium]